jgi:hypothetical protein
MNEFESETQQLYEFKDLLTPSLVHEMGNLGVRGRDIRIDIRDDGNLYLIEVTRKEILLTEDERKSRSLKSVRDRIIEFVSENTPR